MHIGQKGGSERRRKFPLMFTVVGDQQRVVVQVVLWTTQVRYSRLVLMRPGTISSSFSLVCLYVVLLLLSIDAVRCLGVPSRGCLRRRWLRRGRLRLVALGVGGPQGQVVPQQLHDERAVLVRVLVQGVQLGDSVVESLVYVQKGIINIVPEFLQSRKRKTLQAIKVF